MAKKNKATKKADGLKYLLLDHDRDEFTLLETIKDVDVAIEEAVDGEPPLNSFQEEIEQRFTVYKVSSANELKINVDTVIEITTYFPEK